MATPNGRGGWDLTDDDVAEVMAKSFGDAPPLSDENDDYIGTYAPRCPQCGWQAIDRPYTEETHSARYAEARADVAAHRRECPSGFHDSLSRFIDRYTPSPEIPSSPGVESDG